MQSYACQQSLKGRLIKEPKPANRSEFQRDRDRIIHSGAFRKLEYKTQVFVNHEGDYYRTRLTHSLEVAQIARTISRALGLNEDLAEAVALAHDLGHTPFGHAGEDALHDMMRDYGGFDHNDQALRVLTQIEKRYAAFDGLNLTWETLEGLVKHNGPLKGKALPATLAAYNKKHNLDLTTFPSAEAQIAALSDDIAYSNHDIDDGLRANLFSLDDISSVGMVKKSLAKIKAKHKKIAHEILIQEVIRDLIGLMVQDLLKESALRLRKLNPKSPNDIRKAKSPMIAFSKSMRDDLTELKEFLMTHMYRHYRVNRMTSKARRVVKDLFRMFMTEPECLPGPWHDLASGMKEQGRARLIADYIAGMTDRYALEEHKRLFDLYARG